MISQILKTEYAVRGEIVTRAQVLYPFILSTLEEVSGRNYIHFRRYSIFVDVVAEASDAHL